MANETENETEKQTEEKRGLKEQISGMGQIIIGELETLGGVITGDPTTQAEGEFNVEVGTIRDEIEEDLEEEK